MKTGFQFDCALQFDDGRRRLMMVKQRLAEIGMTGGMFRPGPNRTRERLYRTCCRSLCQPDATKVEKRWTGLGGSSRRCFVGSCRRVQISNRLQRQAKVEVGCRMFWMAPDRFAILDNRISTLAIPVECQPQIDACVRTPAIQTQKLPVAMDSFRILPASQTGIAKVVPHIRMLWHFL